MKTKPSLLQILTLLLLLCALPTLSGAVDLAASIAAQQGGDSCCSHVPAKDPPVSDPSSHCSSGDCNCVGCCLPLLTSPPPVVLAVADDSQRKGFRYLPPSPGGIPKSIDYPPEVA